MRAGGILYGGKRIVHSASVQPIAAYTENTQISAKCKDDSRNITRAGYAYGCAGIEMCAGGILYAEDNPFIPLPCILSLRTRKRAYAFATYAYNSRKATRTGCAYI